MQPQDLEPEMEELLLRLYPDLRAEWRGATENEIAQIEQLAGRPLPRFYRWFLMRMGNGMGPLAYPSLRFLVPHILVVYELDEVVAPGPNHFLIAYETDEIMPLHLFYDFRFPARDDARVSKGLYSPAHPQFETFREKIAYGALQMSRVHWAAHKCTGMLHDSGADVLGHLDPAMRSLGFHCPIPTGAHCGLYENPQIAMITYSVPGRPVKYLPFHIGARSSAQIRRVLGEIVAETSLELDIRKWDPPL